MTDRRSGGFTTEFRAAAERELAELPRRIRRRIRRALAALARAPRAGEDTQPMWGEWEGAWRLRVGEYRVIYEIEDRAERVMIVRIRHRSQAYERP